MKTALLVIDVQQALTDERPANQDAFLSNIGALIKEAHTGGHEVIYVRHDGGPGDVLAYGSSGWQLDRSLSPGADERIFDKRFSSSFRQTGLNDYLRSEGISRLVVCGMQTEYCIDTSVKVAFELGYEVIIPAGATSTYANPYLSGEKIISFYERMIWHEPLAKVISMAETLEQLR